MRRGRATREQEAARDAAAQERVQLAAFLVGDELYALDIMRIKEIINPLPITRVPRAPAFLEGVIELRRSILPVVDLRKRFDLPATPEKVMPLEPTATTFAIAASSPAQSWICVGSTPAASRTFLL